MLYRELKESAREGVSLWVSLTIGVVLSTAVYVFLLWQGVPESLAVTRGFVVLVIALVLAHILIPALVARTAPSLGHRPLDQTMTQQEKVPPSFDRDSISVERSPAGQDKRQKPIRLQSSELGLMLRGQHGEYELLEMISSGALSTVYRAYDRSTGDIVALKTIDPNVARNPMIVRSFEREVQIAHKLENPHMVGVRDGGVVRVGDTGEQDYLLFLVMDYVEGLTLSRLLQERGPLPLSEAIDYVDQILDALESLHRLGLVHGDINLSNVFVTPEGSIMVTDFDMVAPSREGVISGTVPYMSPERILGKDPDIRSDLYSVAIILYELLTGRQPFQGNMHEVLYPQVNVSPPSISLIRRDIPPALTRVVERGLAKDPDQRFHSAAAMRAALGATGSGPEVAVGGRTRVDVLQLIDRLEQLASSGTRLPLSSRMMIDEEEFLGIIDQLRVTVPEELKQVRRFSQERERIMQQAEAEKILAAAQESATLMLEDIELFRRARDEARRTADDTEWAAEDTQRRADEYAADVLGTLESELNKLLATMRKGKAMPDR